MFYWNRILAVYHNFHWLLIAKFVDNFIRVKETESGVVVGNFGKIGAGWSRKFHLHLRNSAWQGHSHSRREGWWLSIPGINLSSQSRGVPQPWRIQSVICPEGLTSVVAVRYLTSCAVRANGRLDLRCRAFPLDDQEHWVDQMSRLHTRKSRQAWTPRACLSLVLKARVKCLARDAAKYFYQSLRVPSAVFVLAIALQTKRSLFSTFSKKRGSMPKKFTCFWRYR